MIMFASDGDEVVIENPSDSGEVLELLLIGGLPLNELMSAHPPATARWY
jgi:hypothetical protein